MKLHVIKKRIEIEQEQKSESERVKEREKITENTFLTTK